MHKIVSALTLLVSSAAVAGPKEEALLVLEKWSKAFSDSDVDGIRGFETDIVGSCG